AGFPARCALAATDVADAGARSRRRRALSRDRRADRAAVRAAAPERNGCRQHLRRCDARGAWPQRRRRTARLGPGDAGLAARARRDPRHAPRPALAVVLVGLFLDQRGAELAVDIALDRGALVVAHVDRAREFHETGVECLFLLLDADAVLDVPQRLVHRTQPCALVGDVDARGRVRRPGRVEHFQLGAHIGELGRIADALGLDLEDGDLVDQLAEGNGCGYGAHARLVRTESAQCSRPPVVSAAPPSYDARLAIGPRARRGAAVH